MNEAPPSEAPPFLGRLLALLIGLILTYATLLVYHTVPKLTRDEGINSVIGLLGDSKHYQAQSALNYLRGMFRPFESLPLPPDEGFQFDEWRQTMTLLSSRARLMKSIDQGDYEPQKIRPLVASLPSVLRQDVFTKIQEISRNERAIEDNLATQESIARREIQLGEQRRLLSTDLRALLNLPLIEKRGGKKKEIEVYKEGIFSGLPILPEISSPPNDLGELREALESAYIPLPEISPEVFQERLSELKMVGTRIKETLIKLEQDEVELSREEADLKETRKTLHDDTRTVLINDILSQIEA